MSEANVGGGGSLSGRLALVTGGGTGIGRQFAETLAGLGAEVVVCGRRREPLEETARELSDAGHQARAMAADITEEADCRRLATELPNLDILVNNAGGGRLGPWQDVTPEEWRAVFALNLDAPFRLSQLFVPSMVQRGWGRVVNVASVYGMLVGNPFFYPDFDWDSPAYVTSKHGLIGLTKYLAVRTGGTGVTVNVISPGMFPDTEANRDRSSAESRRRLSTFTPVGCTGNVEDLSSALAFLVAPESGFVTGHNVVVDGGWSLW
ncbi:MAG TPA: SDR family oxidoreductase [Acidimicrobiales bacterium]|nr:SDR family oxidoreductase [Acidimicrobiales bacterium]